MPTQSMIQTLSWVFDLRNRKRKRHQIGTEVVRLAGVAIGHGENPSIWVEQLAADYAGGNREALRRIARAFAAGHSPAEAFRFAPRFFDSVTLIAFEVGEQSLTLEHSFQDHLDRQDFYTNNDASNVQSPSWFSRLVVGFFTLQIWVFMILFIVPSFAEMFDEFGLLLPNVTVIFIGLSNWLGNYWWVFILGLMVCLPVGALLSQLSWFNQSILPLFSRSLRGSRQASLMRSVANVIECGSSQDAAFATIASRHSVGRAHRRYARLGDHASSWDRMLSLGLVSAREANSLEGMPDPVGSVWLLRRLADLRDFESSSKLSIISTLWTTIRTLAFALFVALIWFALFMPLISLITGLA